MLKLVSKPLGSNLTGLGPSNNRLQWSSLCDATESKRYTYLEEALTIKNKGQLKFSVKPRNTRHSDMGSKSPNECIRVLSDDDVSNEFSRRSKLFESFKRAILFSCLFLEISVANIGIVAAQAMDFTKPKESVTTTSCSVFLDNVHRKCSGVTLRMLPDSKNITFHLEKSGSITFLLSPAKAKSDGAYIVVAAFVLPQGDIYYSEKGHVNLNSACYMPVNTKKNLFFCEYRHDQQRLFNAYAFY